MSLYLFYPSRFNGLADTFEIAQLSGDEDVVRHAKAMLVAHANAESIVVFSGQREVAIVLREAPAGHLPAALSAHDTPT